MKAKHVCILAAAAVAAFGVGVLREIIVTHHRNLTQKTEVQTSEAPSLIELIIKDYEDSNDPNQLIAYASTFEQGGKYLDAFPLYEKIGDTVSMQRIATTNFIKSLYPVEGLLERAGLQPNVELYTQRGDHFLEDGHFLRKAFEAYENAHNDNGRRAVASKLEEKGELDRAVDIYLQLKDNESLHRIASKLEESSLSEAFDLYLSSGDKDSAYRIAEEIFITRTYLYDYGIQMLEELKTPITEDLWNRRGDYQFGRKHFEQALKAYKQAGNLEKAVQSKVRL